MLRFTTYVKGKYIYILKVFYNFSKNKPVGLVDLPSFFLGCKLYKNGQVLSFLTVDTSKSLGRLVHFQKLYLYEI